MQTSLLHPIDRTQLQKTFSKVGWSVRGKVTNIVGTVVEAYLPKVRMGTLVDIQVGGLTDKILAEVVGFKDERALLLPFSDLAGIAPGNEVMRHSVVDRVPVGQALLGKVIDPFFNCLNDPSFDLHSLTSSIAVDRQAPNPVARDRIVEPLPLGVKAIDASLTFGNGQRLGIMAGSGVGKSVLMGMIARGTSAEVNVIGLIGERGREVREFLEKDLGPEGLARSIVVCVTSDQSPLMKIRAAKIVHAIAEYFSSQGTKVLLMLDSLTRVAMAQREVGLAVGEPPTTKGYTPSVFSLLPRLLERSGPQTHGWGAISALYTVLVDGDDFNDPIADAARSILDGQVNLTRDLASKGHFPAIDVSTSISRVMNDIVTPKHRKYAQRLKTLIGTYLENIDMVQIGAYQPGTNAELDEAIQLMPVINKFLQQDLTETFSFDETIDRMEGMLAKPNPEHG